MIHRTAPFLYVLILLLGICAVSHAANPPICPHVIGWNTEINQWAKGAPWIKVIYAYDIGLAQSMGAKVFYRPWDADPNYHDDGNLPSGQTGTQYANLVWDKIKDMTKKPDAVGYRNEFNWDNPTASKRTCREFVNYAGRLKALGYTGKVIFGSFGVGWVDAAIWGDTDLKNAVLASDGVETHEYFDLQVNCCAPYLAFRHRDLAINLHPYLQSKEWYIGEFGSDHVCGHCPTCDDSQCRGGWRDNNKLTEQQYIDQMTLYRAGCANQVVAVFVFQQGSPGWSTFEVLGTSVATWMKTTWNQPLSTISGVVKNTNGQNVPGATVKVNPGAFMMQTNDYGFYSVANIPAGTYSVTASKAGYVTQTQADKTLQAGQTITVSFNLSPTEPINTAKTRPDYADIAVDGIVTARFPVNGTQNRIYIEDADRTAGIGVDTATAVAVGDEVQVKGTVITPGGERVISASEVIVMGSNMPLPDRLAMTNKTLGGGQFGSQPAVLDNSTSNTCAKGANNVGLLVRSWGRVTYIDPTGSYFYMDDGSGLQDGSTRKGVRVDTAGLASPSGGSYVVITGISGITQIGGKTVRLLRPRSFGDLSYTTGSNYLQNPGFETGTLASWSSYNTVEGLHSGAWFGEITAKSGSWFLGNGANGGVKAGGIYQRVAVPGGYSYHARAWSRVFRGDNAADAAQNRVGIDPTGGTNPLASTVQWSPVDTQPTGYYSEWRELVTPTVACTGGYVTVFLDMKQVDSAGWKLNCFDDAGLFYMP